MSGLNSFTLNFVSLNGSKSIAASSASQIIISLEQVVSFKESAAGQTLISIDQRINSSSSSQTIFSLEQNVQTTAQESFFIKNGWDVIMTLGGQIIARDQIHSNIKVKKYEGDSSIASFTLMPGSGSYDLYSFQGKKVTISVRDSLGFYKIFTGEVDIPIVDAIGEKITINCISDRKKLLNNLSSIKNTIGFYSSTVAGSDLSVANEIESRLETIPSSLDFDGCNQYTITPWEPKSSPDYSYGSSEVYYRKPTVVIESAKRVTNKVNITFEYSYQRTHQREINYVWSYAGPIFNGVSVTSSADICTKLQKGTTVPRRDMISSAASAAGWYVTNLAFTDVWPGAFYNCSGTTIGWAPIATNGNLVKTGAIDQQGNAVFKPVITSYTDNGSLLCIGASWRARRRFAQNISEQYLLTVQSLQSQLLYGVVEQNLRYQIQSDFSTQEWEGEDVVTEPNSSLNRVESLGSARTYYIDRDTNRGDGNTAIVSAVNRARTLILKSHRDSRIEFEKFITPRLELRHTVALTGKWITGKGKCKLVEHTMDASSGEASTTVHLSLYRSVGNAVDSAFVAPTPPTDSKPVSPAGVSMSSRWGFDPSATAAAAYTGYIGNSYVTTQTEFGTDSSMTQYQESFVVDTPSVPNLYRENRSLAVNQSYTVAIPNDNLSVIFYWDSTA